MSLGTGALSEDKKEILLEVSDMTDSAQWSLGRLTLIGPREIYIDPRS